MTGGVKILRYTVAHDSGRVINPLIVDGQVQGGVAHGIGNALFEWMQYDENAQPLTTSFADYLIPMATDVPICAIAHVETVNPLNPALSRALSAFDVKNNFVVSYSYQILLERWFRAANRLTEGWELSGITHFSSGLPVTLVNYGDNSLLGTEPNGINNYGVDEPDYSGRPLNLNHDPRNERPYFSATVFSENPLGTPGNAPRRFFYGPGMDDYDMALLKNVRLTESKSLQFRLEGFNVFTHAQFFGPQSDDGNIDSSTFAQVMSATAPRLVQLGAKFFF